MMTMSNTRNALKTTLFCVCAINLIFAYIYLLDPSTLSRMYEGATLDYFHQFLGMSTGASFVVLALAAAYGFVAKQERGVVLLIVFAHFAYFLKDVIVLSRAQMRFFTLAPEMVYFIVTAGLLVRFLPGNLNEGASENENGSGSGSGSGVEGSTKRKFGLIGKKKEAAVEEEKEEPILGDLEA